MLSLQVTEHTVQMASHTTFYLAAGPADGPLIIFVLGPNSYYMNHAANARYAAQAGHGGYLDMPTLFLAAATIRASA
jgi:hypothetical protein